MALESCYEYYFEQNYTHAQAAGRSLYELYGVVDYEDIKSIALLSSILYYVVEYTENYKSYIDEYYHLHELCKKIAWHEELNENELKYFNEDMQYLKHKFEEKKFEYENNICRKQNDDISDFYEYKYLVLKKYYECYFDLGYTHEQAVKECISGFENFTINDISREIALYSTVLCQFVRATNNTKLYMNEYQHLIELCNNVTLLEVYDEEEYDAIDYDLSLLRRKYRN